jgi:Flp pilus assembly protein TadG
MWKASKFYQNRIVPRLGRIMPKPVRTFFDNENGASIIIVGLAMPALVGTMGLAAEVSYWELHQRAMQNASDAAAIAAATNATSYYASVAKGIAAQYGFADGTKNVSVAVTAANPSSVPGCASNCYTVTITDQVPLFLSQVVGYAGTTIVGGQPITTLTATSVAKVTKSYSYCILALASSGAQGITANGVPFANLNACNTMSNTSANCNGHNLSANYGDAHTTDTSCGVTKNSYVPAVSDPYAALASNIPSDPCGGSYPQEPTHHNDPALPFSNQWNGNQFISGVKVVCGDQQLTGDTTLNNAVLVIENGQLDTNGFTLKGSNLTVIFTGTNNTNYQHTPTGGGTLDISAPTSGLWSGVAIYQDPNLTTNVNISAAGNSPTWNISGLVYLPHSSVTLDGAVNKSAQGASCFELVVDNITINGTGGIFANDSQCASAGLNTLPQGGNRGMLVH